MRPKYSRSETIKGYLNHYAWLLDNISLADEQYVHATELMDILEKRGKFP